MKLSKDTMTLYAVTDRMWLKNRSLTEVCREALVGGITFLQLREKNLCEEDFLTEAKEIGAIAKEYKIPFVINDNVEVALKAHADGVHIGQEDGNAAAIRREIGADKILGVSVQTVAQAIEAEQNGADYLGVGAMFPTDTKSDALVVTKEELKAISEAVSIPICIIGGVNADTIPQFRGYGANGAAVVSAIFAAENIQKSTEDLLKLCKEVF